MTTTAKRYRAEPTRKHVVQGGETHHWRADRLSASRMIHSTHIAKHVFGVETNNSGVLRAALELWVAHQDAVMKKMATLPDGDERRERLIQLERLRLLSAGRGANTPWHAYPTHEATQRLADPAAASFLFEDLLKAYRAKQRGVRGLWTGVDRVREYLQREESTKC